MAESRGLVKLFGKTIAVPTERDVAAAPVEEAGGGGGGGGAGGGGEEGSKNLSGRSTAAEAQQKDQESASSLEQSEQQTSSSTGSENHKGNPTTDQETPPEKKPKPKPAEEQNSASNGGQEKTIKKPDKILPCPRCKSMDTKFCYYNNYNVNQPRHFCKNCQRYWTAGGTMRNVPVGAGRRKNKHSASHYRHIAVAKAPLHPIRPDITEIVHHTELKPNRTVLSFAPDMPLCESMASVLNIAEKTGYIRNGFHHAEEHVAPFSCASAGAENAEEQNSSGSSVTASNSPGDVGGANIKDPAVQSCQGYPSQLPCFSGTPWPYPWAAAPAMCASSFPISFYPMTPYWGCTVPGAWSVPWMAPLSSSSSPPSSGSAGSGPISPTLGKHSRDGDALAQGSSEDAARQTNGERCLWIPKTLRIDDPEEAAKSSIWATMGFKNDKANGISRGGLFRDFNHPKADISNRAAETSAQVLHANPAALSRSLNFHESS